MSDAAMSPNGDDTPYVVLVYGKPDSEQSMELLRNMKFVSEITNRRILAIRLDFDQFYAGGNAGVGPGGAFGEYLRTFAQILAPSVKIRMVVSCDPSDLVEEAFKLVFSDATYEVL